MGVLWWCSSAVAAVDGVDAVDADAVVAEDVGGYILYMRHPCLCVCERTCSPLTTVLSLCHGNQKHLTNDTTSVDKELIQHMS